MRLPVLTDRMAWPSRTPGQAKQRYLGCMHWGLHSCWPYSASGIRVFWTLMENLQHHNNNQSAPCYEPRVMCMRLCSLMW